MGPCFDFASRLCASDSSSGDGTPSCFGAKAATRSATRPRAASLSFSISSSIVTSGVSCAETATSACVITFSFHGCARADSTMRDAKSASSSSANRSTSRASVAGR